MDRESTPEEDRLFKVLFNLYEKFEDDGKAIVAGFGKLLKEAKIPQHSYVANYFREKGIVSCVKDGRSWLTFWNGGSRPTPQKVQAWYEESKQHANKKKRPHTGSTIEEISDSFKKTAEAFDTKSLKVEQLDVEITRLRKELRIAHDETTMHKNKCIDALSRNNELQLTIKDQEDQIIIFQHDNHKLAQELTDAREESFKEFDLGIGKDLKIEKLKKIIKQLTKVL